MRYAYQLPATKYRNAITGTLKADSEAHARDILAIAVDPDARTDAIVRSVPQTLEALVRHMSRPEFVTRRQAC